MQKLHQVKIDNTHPTPAGIPVNARFLSAVLTGENEATIVFITEDEGLVHQDVVFCVVDLAKGTRIEDGYEALGPLPTHWSHQNLYVFYRR